MTKPLQWSIDWTRPSFKERLLMGCPFVATEDRVYADIVRQLGERDESDLAAWNKYPDEVRLTAADLSERLKADGIWPSTLFLPDDPADIPLGNRFGETDKWDFLPAVFSIVEKTLGIQMDVAWWDGLPGMTYAQAVEQMIRQNGRTSRWNTTELTVPRFTGTAGWRRLCKILCHNILELFAEKKGGVDKRPETCESMDV